MGFVTQVTRESRYRKGGEWGCNTSYKGKHKGKVGNGVCKHKVIGERRKERWGTGFVNSRLQVKA